MNTTIRFLPSCLPHVRALVTANAREQMCSFCSKRMGEVRVLFVGIAGETICDKCARAGAAVLASAEGVKGGA